MNVFYDLFEGEDLAQIHIAALVYYALYVAATLWVIVTGAHHAMVFAVVLVAVATVYVMECREAADLREDLEALGFRTEVVF